VIDVSDPAVREGLGLTDADLVGGWRDATEMTRPQALGAAIAEQRRISGVVYPSVKARAAGFEGSNLVIFRDAVVPPDVVSILGPQDEVLERWP
jgi:RES domain-containing protein